MLRRHRKRRRWSQETLAFEANMDRNHVSLIELGRKSPSVRMLFRLCTALGVSASDLLKEVDKEMHINRNR
ncbi:helix-turn-helix domain-containing protein [Variovorax paradoxus]|uniref:helix-turn-helix domain-containing protein n=1 Tax=Variovorax paradoxus TaxID=34073 RepID=UPI003AAADF0B